ncbi:MAG: plasmid mobilization relaxosome protein MobC [Pseudomonadota bacterium]
MTFEIPPSAIAHRAIGNVLSVYLGAEMKGQWLAFCAANNTTSSEAMRNVIRKLANRVTIGPRLYQVDHENPDLERRRVELRLTATEFLGVEELANQVGNSPNAWIVNLVRANLSRTPQLGLHELQALGKSNSQLLAIGRNLNQIARWMNANKGSAPPELERIEQIYRFIVTHTEEVTAIMRANMDRWILK